jgi:hypothetical protein
MSAPLALVTPEGLPLLNTKSDPAPSEELGTDPAPSMLELVKAAEASARNQSTK